MFSRGKLLLLAVAFAGLVSVFSLLSLQSLVAWTWVSRTVGTRCATLQSSTDHQPTQSDVTVSAHSRHIILTTAFSQDLFIQARIWR
jgi:hypothetical protein